MRITELILHKNKRIGLGYLGTLTYRPIKTMQLILGTNGSGKSTLLQELFPMPILQPSDYATGGYKSITMEHRDSIYTIRSDRTDHGLVHQFIKDDTPLNESGKRNKQMALIEEHFGIDPNVCQILTGQIEFTSMSMSERKKWFIRLSNIDYDYVLSVYLSIKNRYREVRSNIKLIQHKILTAEKTLVDDDTCKKLKSTIDTYRKTIVDLLELKPVIEAPVGPLLESLQRSIDTVTERLVRLVESVDMPYKAVLSRKSEIDNDLSTVEDKINRLEATLEKMVAMEKELQHTDTDIDKKLSELASKMEKQLSTYQYLSIDGIDKFDVILDRVSEIVRPYKPIDTSKKALIESRQQLSSNLRKLDDRLKRLHHILTTHTQETICPKCGFSFIPGTNIGSMEQVRSEYEQIRENYDAIEKQIDQIKQTEQTIDTNESIVGYLVEKSHNHPVLRYIVDMVISDGKIDLDAIGRLYTTVLPVVMEYCTDRSAYEKLRQEKLTMEKYKGIDRHKLKAEIEALEQSLLSLYQERDRYRKAHDAIKKTLAVYEEIKTLRSDLDSHIYKFRQLVKRKMDETIETSIRAYVDSLRMELDKLERQYLDQEKIRYEIENDTRLLSELQQEEHRLQDAMTVLSPEKGLIAMSMVSFIEQFIAQMNERLSQIWEYPIEIQPCVLVDKDLDYRFPVRINDSHQVPDISKTSSSMQEIINLSYKLTFMAAMGLMDWPLYLDEFGRAMDSKHQQNAYAVIDQIQESDFSQVFLISHYEHCYGRFTDADINVLHMENLPQVHPTTTMVFEPV